jgi:hypothetical protein
VEVGAGFTRFYPNSPGFWGIYMVENTATNEINLSGWKPIDWLDF